MEIKVNYHSSICINDEIYFDPLNIKDRGAAKLIFITHPHYDHFSKKDIDMIATPSTKFVCPLFMKEEFVIAGLGEALYVEPNKCYEIEGIKFKTFPAYNTNKKFHPRENNWVGYILKIEGKSVVVTGDTDATSELLEIKYPDVLLLPIGGTFTMTAIEAANAANKIHPRLVIPTHYGSIVGTKDMARDFISHLDDAIKCELKL